MWLKWKQGLLKHGKEKKKQPIATHQERRLRLCCLQGRGNSYKKEVSKSKDIKAKNGNVNLICVSLERRKLQEFSFSQLFWRERKRGNLNF